MCSLRDQLDEKTRLNEVMKLELDTLKRAAKAKTSRAHTPHISLHSGLMWSTKVRLFTSRPVLSHFAK